MPHYRLGLYLAAALLPLAAQADDQPITVTATRIATPAPDVPAGVTVLTQADFAAQGDTTLAQALANVPGLTLAQSGGPGNAASVFMRGANSEDVLVLVDGVPVNDPSEANGAFNFGVYTLADVERVEIVRGPMSGLYGGGAIGGVINIITRRGTRPAQASISLAGGFPAQGQASASVSGVAGRFDYALSGSLDEEAGFDATAQRLAVYAGHRDPYRAKLGAAQFGYALTQQTRLYVILRGQSTDSAFPDLGYPVFDDPNSYDYNTNFFGKLGVSSTLLDGRLHTDLFIARLQTRLHYKNLLDATDPNQASANDVYRGGRTDAQWNNTLRLPDAGAFTYSSLLFGAEYADDTAREHVNESSFGAPFISTVRAAQHSWAGHAGVQSTLASRLTLTAALRDDAVSSFGNALTWRAGGVLAVPEIDTRFKAAGGTGFLAPSLYDLHYIDNYGDSGNPNLRPERSIGWEAGAEVTLPGFGRPEFADLSASYFASTIRNLIQAVPLPSGAYTEANVDRADIDGVETELRLTPANWVTADLTYTYTRAVDARTGTALLRRPQNTGGATLTFIPWPGLNIMPQVQYEGRFNDYLYANSGYPIGVGLARAGTVVNLSASYKLDEHLTLFANGRNILGSRFEPVNGLQIPGASVLIGVRAGFE